MASILTGHCSTCDDTVALETSKKVKGPRGYQRWESKGQGLECDHSAIETEIRQGAATPITVDPKLLYDVQAIVSRLVSKASQLLGNTGRVLDAREIQI